ncbi:MAG: hypothetical protein GEV08_08920 [Acidimicrobiia bacterium]|nr:hypothetical protein [Acidimicrobiia bacterium]
MISLTGHQGESIDPSRYADTAFGSVRRTGGQHGYLAFFPNPIPRQVPISQANLLRLADAEASLGRLAGAGRLLPVPHLLVRPYLRREAVASTPSRAPRPPLSSCSMRRRATSPTAPTSRRS